MRSRTGAGGEVVLVLASASPARLATLRAAGIEPVVEVSTVDEDAVRAASPAELAGTLASLKGSEVSARLAERSTGHSAGPVVEAGRVLVLGCDSVLEVDGMPHGKPETPAVARERLARLSGRSAVLHTGHHLTELPGGMASSAVASTTVTFGTLGADEIATYVETGEPLQVAGAFTIDGLGGAFVERVDGDPHNVVGISLPLLRRMVAARGVAWHRLWNRGDVS